MKVARLSAHAPTAFTPRTYSWYSFLLEAGQSAAGRNMSMRNFNDTIGNGSRDLPVCSAVTEVCSQISELTHPFKGTIINLHTKTSSCSLISSTTMYLVLPAFTSSPFFLLAKTKFMRFSLEYASFRQIYYHHHHQPRAEVYHLISRHPGYPKSF
jgi:hypothetical protein